MSFENLLSPIKIGSLTIRNRMVFPPIDVALRDPVKAVHPQYVEFLSSLVKNNGVGLVISEFASIANGRFWAPASRFYSDEFIPEFEGFAKQIKSYGARFFMQLALLGGRAPKGRCIAPSAIESPLYPRMPEELSRQEIGDLVQKWIEAAVRAKKTGFDGVEVHGGHSYLIGEFMSPHANQRDDEYGYDFNGRMRFPTEIVKGIKDACGVDFPVGFKFSAFEALEDGIRGPLANDIARRLEKIGVDYLHVSSSTYMLGGTSYPDVPPVYVPEGPLTEFAARIKNGVEVPVITVAGIVSPEFAENVLVEGKSDLIAVGRAMFADTQWASKVSSGRASEVRPCIRCNFCHKKMIIDRAGSVECTVNPGLLRSPIGKASSKRKVVIVGSGPAGLEAALQASERGHDVALYERDSDLGGNLRIGAIPPFKKEHRDLLDYFRQRLKKSSIQFLPEHELNAKQIMEEETDAVVIAIGSNEYVPEIPGIHHAGVSLVRGFLQNGRLRQEGNGRVAVIGAGLVGCEMAWYLSLLGREVYLLDILPYDKWLADEHPTNRLILLENLNEGGVHVLDDAKVMEVSAGFHMHVVRDNVEYKIGLDDVVVASGFQPNSRLAQEVRQLKGTNPSPEIHEIGDCAEVRDIHWAIREGYEVGTTI